MRVFVSLANTDVCGDRCVSVVIIDVCGDTEICG